MSTPTPDLVGQIIGSYRIDVPIGAGGMGQVYRGTHLHLRRAVALKIINPQYAGDPAFQERFLREARAAAALSHPNIVQVFDFGEQDERAFLVMELVGGGSLGALLQAGPVDLLAGLDLVRQVARGLAFAHDREMVHRDIKPDNILLETRTPPSPELAGHTAKIADFGLTRMLETSVLTMTGMTMGTPAYMSPEQCQGLAIDGRGDIYSLGVVLYEVATGQRPFDIRNATDAIYQHVHIAPPPPRQRRPDLPVSVERLINACLAKRPEDRPQRADEVVAAIDAILAEETERRTAGTLPTMVAGVPLAGAGAAVAANQAGMG
ncbi:MAG: serine/threonine-protein kinase, partial [Vicinamibacterales bacterium]